MDTSVSNADAAPTATAWGASDDEGARIARCARSLECMAVLAAIVQTGSLGLAAATLGVNTSAARRSISRLEKRLEVKLVERRGRALRLTTAGEVFHAHCLRILKHASEAHAAVGER